MLSIRMRASRRKRIRPAADGARARKCGNTPSAPEMHISGAEGIYGDSDMFNVIREYIGRALSHPRGEPDRITITIEKVKGRARMISSLPVTTLKNTSFSEAENHIARLLDGSGVSGAAIKEGIKVIKRDETMRGAAIVLAGSGERVEPDRARGVRASRLGISASAARMLSRKLAGAGIDTQTVREALILASKVASCRQVVAELCMSDDPDYTTGYVASGRYGYMRIPEMKKRGSRKGGRVFFVEDDADIAMVKEFIEGKPVVISRVNECRGVRSIDEVLNNPHR